MKSFVILVTLIITSLSLNGQALCGQPTKAGTACKNRVTEVGNACHMHGGKADAEVKCIAAQCTANTLKGVQCKNRTTNVAKVCHVHSK